MLISNLDEISSYHAIKFIKIKLSLFIKNEHYIFFVISVKKCGNFFLVKLNIFQLDTISKLKELNELNVSFDIYVLKIQMMRIETHFLCYMYVQTMHILPLPDGGLPFKIVLYADESK